MGVCHCLAWHGMAWVIVILTWLQRAPVPALRASDTQDFVQVGFKMHWNKRDRRLSFTGDGQIYGRQFSQSLFVTARG